MESLAVHSKPKNTVFFRTFSYVKSVDLLCIGTCMYSLVRKVIVSQKYVCSYHFHWLVKTAKINHKFKLFHSSHKIFPISNKSIYLFAIVEKCLSFYSGNLSTPRCMLISTTSCSLCPSVYVLHHFQIPRIHLPQKRNADGGHNRTKYYCC